MSTSPGARWILQDGETDAAAGDEGLGPAGYYGWRRTGGSAGASGTSKFEAVTRRRDGLCRAVVRELQRDPQLLALDQGDDRLQVVPVLAGHAHLVLLDRGLHPDLAVLDEAHDLSGLFLRHAVLQGDGLPHGAARGRLGIAHGERLQVDTAAVQLRLQDVEDGLELHVIARGDGDHHLFLLDLVLRPLEIVAGLDLALRLVDGVGDLLHVELARDVEAVFGGHGGDIIAPMRFGANRSCEPRRARLSGSRAGPPRRRRAA